MSTSTRCKALIARHGDRLVGLMLTNPNTLGLFDEHVAEVLRLVHEAGGLVYGDGANFNAILGIAKPGELGFDVMHYNLHKTFSTPHGGGGPGSGAVGVAAHLADYLPGPIVAQDRGRLLRWVMPAKSIGRVKSFCGNFGVLVRAYTYIRMHGAEGLRAGERERGAQRQLPAGAAARASTRSRTATAPACTSSWRRASWTGAPGINTMDIAKRLMDFEFHPPTVYFPLIVPEALMIEPTETESKETLDAFCRRDDPDRARKRATTPNCSRPRRTTRRSSGWTRCSAAKELQLCYAPGCN